MALFTWYPTSGWGQQLQKCIWVEGKIYISEHQRCFLSAAGRASNLCMRQQDWNYSRQKDRWCFFCQLLKAFRPAVADCQTLSFWDKAKSRRGQQFDILLEFWQGMETLHSPSPISSSLMLFKNTPEWKVEACRINEWIWKLILVVCVHALPWMILDNVSFITY